ncbi:MAG: hypothetical protein DI629_03430 [Mesorhizobium amorphae]|nr:MAG: hypothetical protein DI629_03430 [Mesorhizobium amorphae]
MIDAEAAADFAALGLVIDPALVVEAADEAVPVWDVNWRSMLAWLDCETQWRAVGTFGGVIWLGLDYAGIRPLIEDKAGRADQALFADLRAMEQAALPVLNAPRDA